MNKHFLALGLLLAGGAYADVPNVVTTIKPLHSLVAQVMDGVGEPVLLMTQGSPHGYQMKPSDAKALADADVVVYVDDHLETFLPDVLDKVGKEDSAIEWTALPDVALLKTRSGGMWPPHEHGDHDHDHDHGDADHDHHDHDHSDADHDHHDHDHGDTDHDHHDHDHGDADHDHHDHDHGDADHDHHDHDHGDADHDHHDHDHGDADHDHHDHDHDEAGHAHHHGEYDLHIWLDPHNSAVLVQAVADRLSAADPEHKAQYQANAKEALARISEINGQLGEQLKSVADKPFMSFHDAYQYFERAHGLDGVGVVRVSPEHEPGAARIGEIRQVLADNQVVCLFNEPQFPSKLTAKLVDGTDVHVGTLDPIGANLKAGPALYGQLLTELGDNLYDCLSQ